MFKGGVDQSNPIEENPSNELDLSQGNTESKVMKVRRTLYLHILINQRKVAFKLRAEIRF